MATATPKRKFTSRTWKVLKAACLHRKKGYSVPGGEARAAAILVGMKLVSENMGRKVMSVSATDEGIKLAAAHEKDLTGEELPDAAE